MDTSGCPKGVRNKGIPLYTVFICCQCFKQNHSLGNDMHASIGTQYHWRGEICIYSVRDFGGWTYRLWVRNLRVPPPPYVTPIVPLNFTCTYHNIIYIPAAIRVYTHAASTKFNISHNYSCTYLRGGNSCNVTNLSTNSYIVSIITN